MVVGVPLFFLRTGRDPFNVPKLALLTVGLSLAGALRLAEALQGRGLAQMRRLLVPAAFIAGPMTLAWIFATYRGWSLLGRYGRFQGIVPYILVILLGFLLVDSFQGRSKQLCWALVASGSVVASYAVVQFIGADPLLWAFSYGETRQSLSTLGNSNFAGGFLAIVLPFAVGLALLGGRHRARAVRLSILIFLGLLATKSEGGWSAGFAGVATVLGVWYGSRWRSARYLGPAVAVLAVGGLVAISAYTIVQPQNTQVPETLKLRAWWWQEAGKMAMDSPIVGHGPNAFAVEMYQYRVGAEAEATHFGTTDDPHSVPLSFLANVGFVGLLGFFAVFGWVVWQVRRAGPPDLFTAMFLGGLLAYFVQSFVSIDELTLRVALWTCLAGFTLAQLEASMKPVSKRKEKTKGRQKLAKSAASPIAALKAPVAVGALALIALGGIVWSGGLLVADHRYLRGEQLFAAGRPDEGSEQFERALSFRDEYEMRHSYGFRIGDAGVTLKNERYVAQAQEIFSYVFDFPDVAAIRDYGRVMREWSAVEPAAAAEAERLYELAVQLDSENPRLQEEAANVLE